MHIPLIARLSTSLLPLLSPSPPDSTPAPVHRTLTFQPIHAHAHALLPNTSSPSLLLHDASPTASFFAHDYPIEGLGPDPDIPKLDRSPLSIRTVGRTIRRPRVRPPRIISWALSARAASLTAQGLNGSLAFTESGVEPWVAPDMLDSDGEWDDIEVIAPDLTDRQTVIALAKMTSNAYVTPGGEGWYPIGEYNDTVPFGWEEEADGLRGHIFADDKNETVIVSVKGTSAGVLGSGGPTAKNDKFNDNLLFSCCCARVDFSWSTVCDCYGGGYKCGQTCLEDALVSESVYATVGTNLYNNVTYMYPNATIWLVGHSLGGSISALIGLSFGAPAVTFEAPGDLLPASRLHLPLPPGMPANLSAITHVYHTADPIPMGVCNGAYSGCYAAGFAMESKCHTGETILYDTVGVKGWSVDIRTHRITEVIDKVLADPWPVDEDPKEPKNPEDSGEGVGAWVQAVESLAHVHGVEDQVPARWGWGGRGLHGVLDQVSAWWGWGSRGLHGVQDQVGWGSRGLHGVQDQVSAWWGWGRRGPKKGEGDGEDDDKGGGGYEKHGGVPKPVSEEDCTDCFKWEFGDE